MAGLCEGGNEPAGSLKCILAVCCFPDILKAEKCQLNSYQANVMDKNLHTKGTCTTNRSQVEIGHILDMRAKTDMQWPSNNFRKFYNYIANQATKGNIEGGKFGPVLWIEFGVAQWSERLDIHLNASPFLLQRGTRLENESWPHVSVATMQWYADNNVHRLDWPAQCPDLNPNEHIWDELDRRLKSREMRPTSIVQLSAMLQEEWRCSPVDILHKLVESMPDRVAAVIATRGALYGAETWTLQLSEEKRLEAFEMWIWRRMESVKWTDRIRNETVLERVDEERIMLKLIRKRKRNWLGHWLRRNYLLKDALEEMSILTEDLNMRQVFAKFILKLLLSDEQKQHRLQVSQDVINRAENDSDLLNRTVNQKYYKSVLGRLRENVPKKRPALWRDKNWALHHENAPAHCGFSIRNFLAKFQIPVLPQPPCSPDIAPADFYLLSKLKFSLKENLLVSIEDIQAITEKVLNILKKENFQERFQNWKHRWSRCVQSEGDYFERDPSQ
ncbi:hypothetical protein ANN_14180 [Periplaneta americana]|uniref:Uncharacterized protein n=1 Tax=Periplaneta americana TaxID=6978 RepID=A0ABQ8SWY6_PERAM|nr:hypothetical protein ANN_14180 [Periplaneta americana]